MDKVSRFFEEEFGSIVIIVLILIAIGIILKIVWKINKKMNKTLEPTMSTKQAQAAAEAVELLTKAQKLLDESDDNLEEAIKLRDKVTNTVLPPAKLYIKGKDPRSLLLDVNKRIEGAESRRYVHEVRSSSKRAGVEED